MAAIDHKLATVLVRPQPKPRFEALEAGLAAEGFRIERAWKGGPPLCGDVLVTWNLVSNRGRVAEQFAAARATVIVMENGYISPAADGAVHYAMALDGHNGAGRYRVGIGERFMALGVNLAPWRTQGRHVLVCPQRGIGPAHSRPPPTWADSTVARLRQLTDREIRVRFHPHSHRANGTPEGATRSPAGRPLAEDLAGCHAVVVWNSNAATEALIAGVPVFFTAPHMITAFAADRDLAMIETPLVSYARRLEAFEKLAWGQWALDEIADGTAFRWLLNGPG